MTSEEARAAILAFLQSQTVAVRTRDIVAAIGVHYSQVYSICNRLAYDKLIQRVGAEQLARVVETERGPVRLLPESSAVGWLAPAPAAPPAAVAALEAAWDAEAVEPERTQLPPAVTAVEKLTRLRDRLRGCAAMPNISEAMATELLRIAEGLDDVRDDIVALIVDGPPERDIPGEDFPADVTPTPDYKRNARTRAKNPEPGKRRCSGPCGRLLPIEQFSITDKRSGKRRADCRQCYNAGQRSRYVRAGYKIVTVEVVEGDFCVGHPCPECGLPFEVGQLVQGENVIHATCREEP